MCIIYMHVYKLCMSYSKGQPFTVHDNYLFYYPCHINSESYGALCLFMCVCTHTHKLELAPSEVLPPFRQHIKKGKRRGFCNHIAFCIMPVL